MPMNSLTPIYYTSTDGIKPYKPLKVLKSLNSMPPKALYRISSLLCSGRTLTNTALPYQPER